MFDDLLYPLCRAQQSYQMEVSQYTAWIVSGTLLSIILSFQQGCGAGAGAGAAGAGKFWPGRSRSWNRRNILFGAGVGAGAV